MRGIRRDTEIQSMSGRYASYWNFSFFFFLTVWPSKIILSNCLRSFKGNYTCERNINLDLANLNKNLNVLIVDLMTQEFLKSLRID